MSRELLRHLQDEHAFNSYPSRHNLGAYHVPFSELGTSGSFEQKLCDAAQRAERLMIIGSSGSGKSSLIEHTLGPLAQGVAPIYIPVFGESADIITDVQAVAGMIIQAVVQHVEMPDGERKKAMRWASSQRPLDSKAISGVSVDVSLMGAGLRAEIKRQTTQSMTLPNTASGTLAIVDQLLNAIKEDKLMPVLIFDDTDRWSRKTESGNIEYQDIAIRFFGAVLTELRRLDAGLVVAAHNHYLENKQLKDHIGNTIESRIDIPYLTSSDALGKVLHSRVVKHCMPSGVDKVPSLDKLLLPETLDRLYDLYQGDFSGSLRRVISRVHVALTDACNGGFEVITPELITQAAW